MIEIKNGYSGIVEVGEIDGVRAGDVVEGDEDEMGEEVGVEVEFVVEVGVGVVPKP